MPGLAELRSLERAYQRDGDPTHLDHACALVDGTLRDAPFAAASRIWLGLLRYDRGDGDGYLDAAVDQCAGDGWDTPAVVAAGVPVLLRRCARDGDVADLDLGLALPRPSPPQRSATVPVWMAPAWRSLDLSATYLERYRLRDAGEDLDQALAHARHAVSATRDPVVRVLALGRLAAAEHETYLAGGHRRMLTRVIGRYQRALRLSGPAWVGRRMLLTELGTALQDRFAEDGEEADADLAVDLARTAASGATGPDLACHLVNLGTALSTRHEVTGDPADLNGAVQRWREALDALPTASPYHGAFLDRVTRGLLDLWEEGQANEQVLDDAVDHGRAALRSAASSPVRAVHATHLAAALWHRWEVRRQAGDLHEAVAVYDAAVDGTDDLAATAPDLFSNAAHTLLVRHTAFGCTDDVDRAVAVLDRLTGRPLQPARRATVAGSVAHALAMRYRAHGDPGDLAAALAAARRSLTGVGRGSAIWNSRAARLAHLMYLRFLARGRRRDLDAAIRMAAEIVDGDGHPPTADQVGHLAVYLGERYEVAGDPTNLSRSIGYSRRSQDLDRRGESPHLVANLAAVIHDGFPATGRLDELDQVIDRYRRAVDAEAPNAPDLPTLRNNLGIVLQDRYVYRDDDGALAEAIALHEQAVAGCPPGSPDRPGLLGSLAAALQLRYERDGVEADLERVIALDEEALAALHPSAPERIRLLASLAAARHLDARRAADPARLDLAVSAFATALRRTPARHPARATALRGRASALADRHDRNPHRFRPGRVVDAYGAALAANRDAPVGLIDVATEYAEWAQRHRLWTPLADACLAVRSARRALVGTGQDVTHRDPWLARGDAHGGAEAYACVRAGPDPRRAVAALDAGRALGLSEALDVRSIGDRLRAAGRHALADRYAAITARLTDAARAARRGPGRRPAAPLIPTE